MVTRILLVEDHAAFREPLSFMFDREPEFTVVGQAGSLAEAREMLDGVDVAVFDLDLPDGNGAELIGELRAANPQAMVLVLTASTDRRIHARAVEAGAAGVLHKSARIKDVIDAVRRLKEGETLLSPNQLGELLRLAVQQHAQDREARQAIEQLTPREREVLQALADGLSDKEIAEQLYVGTGTVRNHVASLLSKLGVHSRLQAVVFAARHGAIELG
ncbi:MAG: response regulator transcription factor [Actinomycetota bacterium]|nr:response regulator transcription factor [Actinomycetota bacterium]